MTDAAITERRALKPPAPTAMAVSAHRRTLELERDALRAGAAALALASARGDQAAKEALAALPARHAALTFEIDLNGEAVALAQAEDAAAEKGWRAAIQTLPVDEIIFGINRDECCRRCTAGTPGGCVLAGAARFAGTTCYHPVKESFANNAQGLRVFPLADDPQAAKVFFAACEKLKVRGKFA
jgi:hypothetical protein